MQQALLPERRPELPGYVFWDFYEPAQYVGGDYFDYLPIVPTDPQDDRLPVLDACSGRRGGQGDASKTKI